MTYLLATKHFRKEKEVTELKLQQIQEELNLINKHIDEQNEKLNEVCILLRL